MEVSRRLVHCPLHSETQSNQREGRELEGDQIHIKNPHFMLVCKLLSSLFMESEIHTSLLALYR